MANVIINPSIFAKEVIRNRDRKNVFARFCNRDYEWEIKKAWDTVRVQTLPTLNFTPADISWAWNQTTKVVGTWPWWVITASDYQIWLENLVINRYAPLRVTLTKHEITQSNLALETKVASRFTEAEARMVDDQVRDQILVTQVADIPAWNKINSWSPITLTKTNIFAEIEKMRVALAVQNVTDNLALFVSPSAQSVLLQSWLLDNTDRWLMTREKGYMGMISWVKVYMTNALTASQEMIMLQDNSINLVIQLNDYKVKEAVDWFYFNLLAEIVWWLKIFDENAKAIAINYVDTVTL